MADIFFWPNNGKSNLNTLRLNETNVTVDGINFKYNVVTGIITVNGTRTSDSGHISFLKTYCYLRPPEETTISVSSEYIGGTVTNGKLVLELPPVLDGTGHNGSDRFNLDMGNKSTKKQGLTLKSGNGQTAELWAWSDGGNVSFNNYQVRIKVEQSKTATPWSPNPKESSPGSTYGDLPRYTYPGRIFNEWHIHGDVNTVINSSSIQVGNSQGNINLVAGWIIVPYTNTIHHWQRVPDGTGNNGGANDYFLLKTTEFTSIYDEVVTIPNSHVQDFSGLTNTGIAGSPNWSEAYSTKSIGETYIQPDRNVLIDYFYHPNNYTLQVDLDGGSWSLDDTTISIDFEWPISLPIPEKPGYAFGGWFGTTYGIMSNSLFACSVLSSKNSNTRGIRVYNNEDNGVVSHIYHTDTKNEKPKYSDDYIEIIKTEGVATPGSGGYVRNVFPEENTYYYHTFYAKVPKGYYIEHHENEQGTGYQFKWLTSQQGTGKWKLYAYMFTPGIGEGKDFGYVAVHANDGNNSKSVTWYLGANQITKDPEAEQTFTPKEGDCWIYAIWIPIGTAYIYTDGDWKRAIPYVYDGEDWRETISYIYTDNGWKQGTY